MDFDSEGSNSTTLASRRLELSARHTTISPLSDNITALEFEGDAAVARHLVEPAIANAPIDTEETRHDPDQTLGNNNPPYRPHYQTLVTIIVVLILLLAGMVGLASIYSRF